MSYWRQFLVFKNLSDDELDSAEMKVVDYLINRKVISTEQKDNVLGDGTGYCPGEKWHIAVDYPEEKHFLSSNTNGMEVSKGRTVFWADGRGFEAISCPNCGHNNVDCEWSDLFCIWMQNPNAALLTCKHCYKENSICEYNFDPKWALGNFGITFWGWPMLKVSFITQLALYMNCEIEKVEGSM